jgi:hypothetical protein
MKRFENLYPTICSLDTIGFSLDGKSILVLKISDNVNQDESEPNFLYTSSMHGNEIGGFVLMLRLADLLVKDYGSDQRITELVNNLQIWINPLANPDGTYRSYDSVYIPIRRNSNGVDLNRNFPDPADGPHPDGNEYQPETIAMMDFLEKHPPAMSANFHSGAEVANYPWDTWQTSNPGGPGYHSAHPDDNWFQMISKEYADTAQFYGPTGYFTNPASAGYILGGNWYMINGGRQDYVTYFLGGREVTLEIDNAIPTPESDLDDLWQYNYRSMLNYMEQALYGIRGSVRDSVTNEPVKAKIEILNHDMDSSHIYSDSLKGDYYRLINSGTYQLKFSTPGYYDKIVNDVTVLNRQVTQLDIKLVPVNSSVEEVLPGSTDFNYYPNPCHNNLTVSGTLNELNHLEIQIFDILGKKQMIPYSSFHGKGAFKVELDLNRLHPGTYIIRSIVANKIVDQRIIRKQ